RRQSLMAWADAAAERWTDPLFGAELRQKLAAAERGESFPGWEYLTPLVEPLTATALDYLARNTLVVVDDPAEVERHGAQFADRLAARFAETQENGELAIAPEDLFLTGDAFREAVEQFARLDLRVLGKAAARVDAEFELDGGGRPLFYFPLPFEAEDIHIASQ